MAPGGAEGRRGAVLSLRALPPSAPPLLERRLLGDAAPAVVAEEEAVARRGEVRSAEVRSPALLAVNTPCGWRGVRWGPGGGERGGAPLGGAGPSLAVGERVL